MPLGLIGSLVCWRQSTSFVRALASRFLCWQLKPLTVTDSIHTTSNIWTVSAEVRKLMMRRPAARWASPPSQILHLFTTSQWREQTLRSFDQVQEQGQIPSCRALQSFRGANHTRRGRKVAISPDLRGKINIFPRFVGALVVDEATWASLRGPDVRLQWAQRGNSLLIISGHFLVWFWGKQNTLFSLACERGSAPFASPQCVKCGERV